MHARVTAFRSRPDIADGALRPAVHTVAQGAWDRAGILAVIDLVNRMTGEALVITLWEDEDAMAATDEFARLAHQRAAAEGAEQVERVATFEVGLIHVKDSLGSVGRIAR